MNAADAPAGMGADVLPHDVRRMLQSLDAYWAVCEGYGPPKWRHPRSDNLAEHWWGKFERYRKRVEADLRTGG